MRELRSTTPIWSLGQCGARSETDPKRRESVKNIGECIGNLLSPKSIWDEAKKLRLLKIGGNR